MRICIVYDCLYPHTIGGAQRWYRALAERLAGRGHEVTYLTLRQWRRGEGAGVPGVDVRVVGPRMELYGRGRRRTLPPVVFGLGVAWHLLRRGRRYDVVHTGSMPYFPVLAALALRSRGYRLFVDWIEVWTRPYWHDYAGRVVGEIGWRIQRLCARSRHRAFALARLHAQRLEELGHEGGVAVIDGLYADGGGALPEEAREPVVVFAGRHIPEKSVPSIVPAIAKAREHVPVLRCELYGDGPDREEVLRLVGELGLNGAVAAPGFVEDDRIAHAISRALCFALPSRREGYGLVVVEAAAAGTPSVVVAHPDNAAVELVEDGVNGVVARSAAPEVLADAILRVYAEGEALRKSTRAWFERNAKRLSIETSVDRVEAAYREACESR